MLRVQPCVFVVACLLMWTANGLADEPELQLGWATEGEGTTGGAGGTEYSVANAEEFARALKANSPKVIRITAAIKLKEAARVTSDTTLIGDGTKASISGGGLQLRRVHNVIMRNLVITEASDAINIEESHHVWIDHCDLSNCRDGLIDIKRGSDFITVSWNHFHDHHKTCLLGHSDKDDIRELDRGHLRVTYHHNYFDGTKTRHPRVRFAEGVHVLNNYFRQNEYGVASVMDAGVIVEANVFEDVEHPTHIAYGDSPDPGRLAAHDNLLIRSGKIETRGVVDKASLKYEYTVDPVNSIRSLVASQAGVHRSLSINDTQPITAEEASVVRIKIKANADGGIAELILDGEIITAPKDGKQTRLDVLQSRIRGLVEDSKGRRKEKDFEAELQYDGDLLKYEHVVDVISAISGYRVEPGDDLIKLIVKIKFVPMLREPGRTDHNPCDSFCISYL